MSVVLGPNQYGKAEVRLVTVNRDGPRHSLRDLNISTALRGEFDETHLTGDNAAVLPTDTQKNTVYAFAKQAPVGDIEDFAQRLGRHFVTSQDPVRSARVSIEEFGWDRIPAGGAEHDHAFARSGDEKRTTTVTVDESSTHVISGLKDLVVLKSTGSEFWGYPTDEYTTLSETEDRVLATAVTARWRFLTTTVDWTKSFEAVRAALLEAFATTHSYALQQTLYAMGKAVLEQCSEVAEVRLSLPNKHHFRADLSPFGLDNDNEIFLAADRPYGLIEGTVTRDDVSPCPEAWRGLPEF